MYKLISTKNYKELLSKATALDAIRTKEKAETVELKHCYTDKAGNNWYEFADPLEIKAIQIGRAHV